MNETRHRRAKAIFLAALELRPDELRPYLERECGSDGDLRAEVDSLLEHALTETREFSPFFAQAAVVGQELLRERFEPGARIAGRYVVLRRLGAGGMGEVYLARDERLEVEVALKFLPRAMAENPRAMQRLVDEARMARGITHPSVCRIHDVGESDGEPFLTMEFIEGVDLTTFLQRAGTLSREQIRRMARELCAALAAAHQQGVVHGDLKPANVLVDREGRPHVADFGLAGPMGEARVRDVAGGSPAYMAPELLVGGTPTAKSDLFSLGLVLFELSARRRAYESHHAIRAAAAEGAAPPSPGSVDPVLERIVRRALSHDPDDRPRSAALLEEALSEPDDLAAVLRLGELPSPELVAASGARGLLSPRAAWRLFAIFAVLLAVLVPLSARTRPVQRAAPELPPAVFAQRADALLDELAGPEAFREHAFAYRGREVLQPLRAGDERYLLHRAREGGDDLCFWYRRAHESLAPQNAWTLSYSRGRTQADDPPLLQRGTQTVVLDLAEHLVLFVDADVADAPVEPELASETDWEPFFERAGLRLSDFTRAPPLLPIESVAHERASFRSVSERNGEPDLHIEVGARAGRPVYFGVFAGAVRAEPTVRAKQRELLSGRIYDALLILVIGFAIVAGWHHLRTGRGDPWGSLRIGVFVLAMRVWDWLLRASHTRDVSEEATLFIYGFASGLFDALLAWGCAMGVEPFVRRHWPRVLVSWSRLLRGRVRDPLVASHVLIGAAVGLWMAIAGALDAALAGGSDRTGGPPVPDYVLDALSGPARWIAVLPVEAVNALVNALTLLAVLVLARLALRRNGTALVLAIGVIGLVDVLAARDPAIAWATIGLGQVGVGYLVLASLGVLPYAVALFVQYLVEDFPLTPEVASWYGPAALFVLPVVAGLAGWALWTLLRSRRVAPA